MTLPRLRDISSYQREHPPVHVLVASYMGVGQASKKAAELDEQGQSLFDVMPQSPKPHT